MYSNDGRSRRVRAGGLAVWLCTAALLVSCTTTVGGGAQFPEDAEPIPQGLAAIDPCELIPEDWLEPLELREGEYTEGDERARLPPGCDWRPSELGSDGEVTVRVATDMPAAAYDPDIDSAPTLEFGGLDWNVTHGPAGLEGFCFLTHVVSDDSFVSISSAHLSDESMACDMAEEAAPAIAAQLPGGEPLPEAPEIDESPVANVDACELLAHEAAEDLGYHAPGQPSGSADRNTCTWSPADGDSDLAEVVVGINTDTTLDRRFDRDPVEELSVNDRAWYVYAESESSCYGAIETSVQSFVFVSGYVDGELDRACGQVEDLVPVVTDELPSN